MGRREIFRNPSDPNSARFGSSRATVYSMPFDPNHEFFDIQKQLYAPGSPPGGSITMGGFLASAQATAPSFEAAVQVMEGYFPEQLPALSLLTREFAVFNYWHASLPGPTWPNRFFVHAATSGGLTDSPTTEQILQGYEFAGGTIYDRIKRAGRNWRIYHDGVSQTVGIDSLRVDYLDLLSSHFVPMSKFASDVAAGKLPEYTFIEPNYDTGSNYVGGNSMHPLNDIRKGEALLKSVYETLRQSALWDSTMLIVTFDEHGGFFDHVKPPPAVPTGDDSKYADKPPRFDFKFYGTRVPGLVISAYTQAGSIIGSPPAAPTMIFDHTSILKTVEQRFGLAPLTQRDAGANSLAVALNLTVPRTNAPLVLPSPVTDAQAAALGTASAVTPAPSDQKLSANQQSLVDLALRCNLDMADPAQHLALKAEHSAVTTHGAAAAYLAKFDATLERRRASAK